MLSNKESEECYEWYLCICTDFLWGKITHDQCRHLFAELQEEYRVGFGMENELDWLKWQIDHTQMHPAQRCLFKKRLEKLSQ